MFEKIKSWLKKFCSKPQVVNTKEYRDLAPVSDVENSKEYINALDWALSNSKVRNIALAGPYGAGKSSIIDTYIKYDKNNKQRKSKNLSKISLKISMATFALENSEVVSVTADEVEQGILKQLFYKVNKHKIPQSRYRKLYVKSFCRIFIKVFIGLSITLLMMRIFLPENYSYIWNSITNFINSYVLLEESSQLPNLLWLFLFLLANGIISYLCYWGAGKYSLKEIKITSNAKFEADCKTSESIFNKNLDEIMYFFEATKYRIVFFEDLDRLNDRKIFIHLRELNNLLNNDDSIKEKPIVFIYAIKDNIFTNEDRTKFFDFIIPVIPVINSTNSGEILLKMLQETKDDEVKNNISEEFVFDVSPYISDMRMLQNIYNEFTIYKNTIKDAQGLSLSEEQMMAMIIFKNLYPSDFADIQAEKGIIKKAFENKKIYVKEKKDTLQKKIVDFENILVKAETDNLNSIKELKAAMLMLLIDNVGKVYNINYKSKNINVEDILDDSFNMEDFKECDNLIIDYRNYYGSTERKNINNFKEFVKPYIERWKSLKILGLENLNDLREENECRKKKYMDLSGQSLATIISENKDFKFDDEVSKNKLLVFLLRRGYIDEKYANYINYFKGNSITTADMNFILSVKNQEAKAFDYSLTKTSAVVKRLQYYEFAQKEIYNFDLLEYMLSSNVENEKLEIFLKQLSDEIKISWDFIDTFFDRTTYQQKFINRLADIWPGIWEFILKQSLSYDRQLRYLAHIINSGQTIFEKCNKNASIKNYIESHSDILQKLLQYVSIEQLCLVIEKLNIVFKNQEINGVNSRVIDYIFDNRHYEINEKMIANIVTFKKKELSNDLDTKPYTTINNLGYDKLTEYIFDNFEEYIKLNIMTKDKLYDNIEHILDMLSRLIINNKYCSEIIEREQFKVIDIKQFFSNKIVDYKDDVYTIWSALLMNNKVISSWQNVVEYWKHFSLDQCLVEYITLNVDDLETDDKQGCNDSFIHDFINSNFSYEVYRKLLPVMPMEIFDVALEKLSEEMLELMIEIKYFDFTLERYQYLEKTYHDLAIKYIVNNQKIAFEQLDKIPMSNDLLEELLGNKFIDNDNKEILCRLFAEKYMADNIVKRILQLNIKIEMSCFIRAWNISSTDLKEQLFLAYFDLLDVNDLEKCFAELGERYNDFKDRSGRYTAKLNYNESNLQLAKYLKDVGYITSYKLITGNDKKSDEKYSAISCKIKKSG